MDETACRQSVALDNPDGVHTENVAPGEPACFACLDSDGERRSNVAWSINHGQEGVVELPNGDLLVYDTNCTFTQPTGSQVSCTSDNVRISIVVYLAGECK